MNRFLGVLFLAALIAVPFGAHAHQTPVPTPTTNPQTYNDLGMHFTAPAQFHGLMQRKMKVADLGNDPTVVAAWTTLDQRPRRLLIVLAGFTGTLDGWENTYSQWLRNSGPDGTLIKNHQSVTLNNGMPAHYIEMTTGQGFDVTKNFIVLWADGQRGVALVISASIGDMDEKTAKAALLGDVSAVRYPLYREQDGP